jgi:hypothetical protein
MPFPSASLGWFDQDHHHSAKQIDGQPAEHPFGEEAGVFFEDLKDPLVLERSSPRFPFGMRHDDGSAWCRLVAVG